MFLLKRADPIQSAGNLACMVQVTTTRATCLMTPPEDLRANVSIGFLSRIAIVGDLGIDVERPKSVHKCAPDASIAFNTRPEDTPDAAARWLKGK